jgi:hypothetical protein
VKGQKGGYKFEKLPYNPFKSQQQQQQQHHEQLQQQQDITSRSPMQCNSTFMVRDFELYKCIYMKAIW